MNGGKIMGYSASGSGSATLKKGCASELKGILEKTVKDPKADFINSFDWDIFKNTYKDEENEVISLSEYDDHWHEEDTMTFLNLLTPHIVDGCIDYNGEDDCHWRYKFLPSEEGWISEGGEITYESDFRNFKFAENDGDGIYKSGQINEHLKAMEDDSHYMAKLTGVSAKNIGNINYEKILYFQHPSSINLDKNALEILKAYYSGQEIRIKKDV